MPKKKKHEATPILERFIDYLQHPQNCFLDKLLLAGFMPVGIQEGIHSIPSQASGPSSNCPSTTSPVSIHYLTRLRPGEVDWSLPTSKNKLLLIWAGYVLNQRLSTSQPCRYSPRLCTQAVGGTVLPWGQTNFFSGNFTCIPEMTATKW